MMDSRSDNESPDSSELSFGDVPIDFGELRNSPSDSKNFPKIPGYQIVRLIGQGGMGAVYEAVCDKELESSVAIKTIFIQKFQSVTISARKRFDREMDLLQGLNHPHIVPVLDRGSYEREYQQIPFFVMPLLKNGDLSTALEDLPIVDREHLRKWVQRLSGAIEGLSYSHGQGVVHRDLKPRNLFVADDGSLLLGDFGLAKILEEDSELTSTIGHMGTTPYAPPEQLLSAKLADERADIYSLGVILHQFACFGKRPFSPEAHSENSSSETDSIARWQRNTNRTPPRPSDREKHLSDSSFDFIVQKCCAYYPEHRYQTAAELLADLGAWRSGKVVRGTLKEQFRNRVAQPLRRNWVPAVIASGLLIFLASCIAWAGYSSLSGDVVSLTEDIAAMKKSEIEKRLEKSRAELEKMFPRLQGEARDYEIRRMTNPQKEFAESNKRAQEIGLELGLANSDSPRDRHIHWCIQRTAVSANDGVAEYLVHLRELDSYVTDSLDFAADDSKECLSLAVSDLLRTFQMQLRACWQLGGNEHKRIFDTETIQKECLDRMISLRKSVGNRIDAATQRHLALMILLAETNARGETSQQVWERFSKHKDEISASRLVADGCKQLHTWYVAWYVFENFYEAAVELGLDAKDKMPIVDGWYDVTVGSPVPAKSQNFTYAMDVFDVMDRRADLYRDLGEFEKARHCYEENLKEIEPMKKFHPFESKSWDKAEQSFSSLRKLFERTNDKESLLLNFDREQSHYREKIRLLESNPDKFSSSNLPQSKFELAESLFNKARIVDASEQQQLLVEASENLLAALEIDSECSEAETLLNAIRALQK
jgi:serine/threonine protein kinase